MRNLLLATGLSHEGQEEDEVVGADKAVVVLVKDAGVHVSTIERASAIVAVRLGGVILGIRVGAACDAGAGVEASAILICSGGVVIRGADVRATKDFAGAVIFGGFLVKVRGF